MSNAVLLDIIQNLSIVALAIYAYFLTVRHNKLDETTAALTKEVQNIAKVYGERLVELKNSIK